MRWIVGLLAVAALVAWLVSSDDRSERAGRDDRAAKRVRESSAETATEPDSQGGPTYTAPDLGKSARTCRVVVRNESGEPVWGAGVEIDREGFLAATTDRTGVVDFEWPEGEWQTVEVTHPEYARSVKKHEFAWTIHIVLKHESALRGRVMFPDGKPVPDHPIRVAVSGQRYDVRTTTNAKGRFAVPGLEGTEVVVKCAGASPDSILCAPQARDLRFRLDRSVLVVRVRDEAGKRIEDALVMVRPIRLSVDDDIGLDRELVEPGTDLEVHVMKRGFRQAVRKVASWSEQPSLHEIEVRLEPAPLASVLVNLTNADGSVPERVFVQVFKASSEKRHIDFLHPLKGAQFRVPDLDPGPIKLIFAAQSAMYLTRTIEVMAREEPKEVHTLRFPTGGDAVLRWPAAQPRDLVLLVPVDGGPSILAVPEGGRYQPVEQVPVGDYHWRVTRNEKLIREAPVTVREGETVETDWSGAKK